MASTDPPRLTRFTCSACGYTSYDSSNITKHIRVPKCDGAQVLKEPCYILAYTFDPSLASQTGPIHRGMNTAPATNLPAPAATTNQHITGHHNDTTTTTINGTTININVNIPEGVLPSRSPQELQAMIKLFLENDDKLADALEESLHNIPGFLAYVFHHTKVEGPPELRNMYVKGNDVYEVSEDGGTRKTPLVKCLNAWNHIMMRCVSDLLERADLVDIRDNLDLAAQACYDALFKPLAKKETLDDVATKGMSRFGARETHTVEEAAKMLHEDSAAFNRLGSTLKHNVKECRARLAEKMEGLRKRAR